MEGAGGLMVPITADFMILDLMRKLAAPVVLVARTGLGTLNHTLLSVEALRSRQITVAALFLVGPPHPSNRATLGALAEVERIFELPQLQVLDVPTLDAWLDQHDLQELFA